MRSAASLAYPLAGDWAFLFLLTRDWCGRAGGSDWLWGLSLGLGRGATAAVWAYMCVYMVCGSSVHPWDGWYYGGTGWYYGGTMHACWGFCGSHAVPHRARPRTVPQQCLMLTPTLTLTLTLTPGRCPSGGRRDAHRECSDSHPRLHLGMGRRGPDCAPDSGCFSLTLTFTPTPNPNPNPNLNNSNPNPNPNPNSNPDPDPNPNPNLNPKPNPGR